MLLPRKVKAALLALAIGASIAQAQQPHHDVTGKWLVIGSSPTGPVSSTVLLKQEGDALSGAIEIARVGWAKVTGRVRGDTVRSVFPLTMQGTPIEVLVTGVLVGADSMSGMVELPNDMGSHPFTARRQLLPAPDDVSVIRADWPVFRPPPPRVAHAALDLAHDASLGRSLHAVGSPDPAAAVGRHDRRVGR